MYKLRANPYARVALDQMDPRGASTLPEKEQGHRLGQDARACRFLYRAFSIRDSTGGSFAWTVVERTAASFHENRVATASDRTWLKGRSPFLRDRLDPVR